MPIQPVRLTAIICAFSGAAWGQLALTPGRSQIEQARQFEIPISRVETTAKPKSDSSEIEAFDAEFDDAFGAQVILKENAVVRAFTGWAEVSGFYTNNVALTRRGAVDDTFLTNTFGLSYRKVLKPTIAFDATIRGTLYRYNRFNELDFQSLDPSLTLTWAPEKIPNTAFFVRYGFNQLTSASSGDEFFNNHQIAIGVQKVWQLSRAHSVFAGAQAQWTWADPTDSQRDEYSVFVGYHADIARDFGVDLNYRFAYFDYRESEVGRADKNQSLTLALRYSLEEWLSVSASSFWTTNKSNFDVFGYDAWNLGGGIGLQAKF
jgi:hypothetical protein